MEAGRRAASARREGSTRIRKDREDSICMLDHRRHFLTIFLPVSFYCVHIGARSYAYFRRCRSRAPYAGPCFRAIFHPLLVLRRPTPPSIRLCAELTTDNVLEAYDFPANLDGWAVDGLLEPLRAAGAGTQVQTHQ
jgi:hypothetical protein